MGFEKDRLPQERSAGRRRWRRAWFAGVVLAVLAGALPGGAVTQTAPDGTILGGTEAQPGAYPFMAAIVFRGGDSYQAQFCGGTVIDPEWVLTAAHCAFDGSVPTDMEVIVGRHDLGSQQGERIGVMGVVGHPAYNERTAAYDLALLHLEGPTSAPPVRLASADWTVSAGAIARAIGWGDTLLGFPYTLQQIDVPMVSDQQCASYWGSDFSPESMVCAGGFFEGGNADVCAGDSGGPLLLWDSSGWLQVGVVSYGSPCSQGGSPGVYGEVAGVRDWITATIGVSWNGTFSDDDGSVHESNIEAIAAAGITRGCNQSGDLYCPDDSVTRDQMAAFLARALSLPAGVSTPFTDIAGSPFAGEIGAVFAAGITRGCNQSGDLYCPLDAVRRGQMAAFLARALSLPAGVSTPFTDIAGSPFAGDIAAIFAAGITQGATATTYDPDGLVTRAQMASFLARALGLG